MKHLSFLLFLVLFSFTSESVAQESQRGDRTDTVYLGYPAGVFDSPDLGLYLGYSLEMVRMPRFSWEAQASLSYSIFDRDSDNFAHDGGQTFVANGLFGPRFYLVKPEKSTRLYFNFLLGLSAIYDQEFQDYIDGTEFLEGIAMLTYGYSLGSYLQIKNRFILGVAFEQYSSMVVKFGYKI